MEAGADDVTLWVERLSAAAEQGESLDLAEGLAPDSTARNPAGGNEWARERQIPAAALRIVLINRNLVVDPHGIRINGARIIGPVDLENIKFEHALRLTACRIEDHIDLTGSTLKELNLNGSHIKSLDLEQAAIIGDLFAEDGFTATGEVRAVGAKIGGLLSLNGATLTNSGGDALYLDMATIAGGVFANDGFTATGHVRAVGAKVGGPFSLSGATLTGTDGYALSLDQATIAGGVSADGEFNATGQVRAVGAKIGGQLSLNGATLTNLDGHALSLDQATIAGGVFASDGFTATGQVRAVGAKIGGPFSLKGAALRNPGGDALSLDQATIAGDLFADDRFKATGHVRAPGAKINGRLSLKGAALRNPGGDALTLDQATIAGDLFADDGFKATGHVRAPGAKIGGRLSLDGAALRNPGGDALTLDQATITGGVFAENGFNATGHVGAFGAKISLLSVEGATLANPDGCALDLESSAITTLKLMPARVDGTIDLTRATIADLRTPSQTPPPGRLIATGWQITDVHGQIRTDRRAATKWLKATPSRHGFTAQPWHALAAVYERNGQPADARRLRFTAANQTTQHAPWPTKPLRWIYLAVAGHGYYPLLAAVWLAGALLLGVFITDHNTEHFIPTDRAAADKTAAAYAAETHTSAPQPITAADSCSRYPGYPCFNTLNYALAGVVPAATGVTKADWVINSTAPAVLTLGLPALRILAWIFTAILLAGVTGLLRKG